MAKQRGNDVFKDKWLLECAIEVTARDIMTSKPTSAVCKFCKTFGKEEPADNDTRKRKRSQNIQLFKKPWRADKMKEHHNRMHKTKWEEYQTLSNMDKKSYFDDKAPPPPNSILRTFHRHVKQRTVFCDKEIVEVLLDDLLFAANEDVRDTDALEYDDTGGGGVSNISTIFTLVEAETDSHEYDEINGRELYKASIPNVYQYDHVIAMVSCGLSFRQTSNVIEKCKSLSNDTKFGCISLKKVTKFVRIHCGMSLQIIKRALNAV